MRRQRAGILARIPIRESPIRARYGGAVNDKRAADLYAQGRTPRQISAELGVHWATVRERLHQAGVTMRRGAGELLHGQRRSVVDGSGSGERR